MMTHSKFPIWNGGVHFSGGVLALQGKVHFVEKFSCAGGLVVGEVLYG